MASVPPCPRGWVASGPPLRFRRPQCRPSAATGGPISSLVGGWPQCLPSAAQAPPYPPQLVALRLSLGRLPTAELRPNTPIAAISPLARAPPFSSLASPPCLLPRHHAPFSSLVDGWLNASFPATQAHLTPFPPASPCPPPRADPRHPPWVARPMTARPFPIRRPALTVRLPYSTQATFGGGLFPPPLLPYTPGFGMETVLPGQVLSVVLTRPGPPSSRGGKS